MTYRTPEPLSGDPVPGEQHWEQPSFSTTAPQAPTWAAQGPVWDGRVQAWGEVVPVPARVVVPPSPQEETLRTVRRLILPIALVLGVLSGEWLPVLVLALVVNAILKRRLAWARLQRLQLTSDLR